MENKFKNQILSENLQNQTIQNKKETIKYGEEEVEDTTKYGEFVTSYFAWVPMSKQKENVEKLENITITYSKCLVLFLMCFIPFRNELELLLGTYIKVYAVCFAAKMRWALALTKWIIRSWCSVFLLHTPRLCITLPSVSENSIVSMRFPSLS